MIYLSSSENINQMFVTDDGFFVVPLYQRRYVWDDTNLVRIWEDIIDQVNIPSTERGEGHFTGPIVTRSIDGNQNSYEVIDGQQRLTTLQIILCVIRDLCTGVRGLKNGGVAKDAEEHVLESPENHRLTLTKYDRLTFKEIVNRKYGEKFHDAFDETKSELQPEKIAEVISKVYRGKPISSNILDAYKFFYRQIRRHIQKGEVNAANLFSVITSDFKLMHLSLNETDRVEAEDVFESINATGLMLSDFDYLRNNLFLRARKLGSDSEGKLKRDNFYNDRDYWPFEEDFWNAKRQRSFLRTFLKAAWDPACLEEENPKSFEEYRKYSKDLEKTYSDDRKRILYEFKQLSAWAESYRRLKENPTYKDYENFRKNLGLPDLDAFLLYVTQVATFIQIAALYSLR